MSSRYSRCVFDGSIATKALAPAVCLSLPLAFVLGIEHFAVVKSRQIIPETIIMPSIQAAPADTFEVEADVVIIGAGAGGLIAALRAVEAGASVLVLERDALPRGSTALSAGLIPAAGTRFQVAAGLADSPDLFAADIQRKAKGKADRARVDIAVGAVAPALEWLADHHGLPFSVIDNFTYPGHSAFRMHGCPPAPVRS